MCVALRNPDASDALSARAGVSAGLWWSFEEVSPPRFDRSVALYRVSGPFSCQEGRTIHEEEQKGSAVVLQVRHR